MVKCRNRISAVKSSRRCRGLCECSGGELILSERDREKYGEKLEKLLEENGGGKYSLSEETRRIKAGVIVKRGSVYVNGSIEARIDAMRSELVPEVAARLFK